MSRRSQGRNGRTRRARQLSLARQAEHALRLGVEVESLRVYIDRLISKQFLDAAKKLGVAAGGEFDSYVRAVLGDIARKGKLP